MTAPVEFTHQDVMDRLAANYLGDGLIYADLHRNLFLHDNVRGMWREWQGHRWADDAMYHHDAAVEAVALAYADQIPVIEAQVRDALAEENAPRTKYLRKLRDKLTQRVDRLRSTSGRAQCLEFARKGIEHPLAVVGDEFDRNPDLIGMPNGVMDMRTGDFRDGRRLDYITKNLGMEWPGWKAKCPELLQFLHEVLDDPATERMVILWLGYCLTGRVDLQKIMIWNGEGRNGKGVLVNIALKLMGDYASPGQSELLLDSGRVRNSASHSADICMLQGLRSLWFNEVPETAKWDTSRMKTFSGGDVQVARGVNEKTYARIYPTWKLNIICNDLPKFNGLDRALLDRLIMVLFPFEFAYQPFGSFQKLRDDNMIMRMLTVLANALPMLVEAGMEVLQHGLTPSPSSIAFRTEYALDNDPMSAWVADCVVYSYGASTEFSEAYKSFCDWWETNKGKRTPPSDNWFGRNIVRAKVMVDGKPAQIHKHRGKTVTYPDIILLTS